MDVEKAMSLSEEEVDIENDNPKQDACNTLSKAQQRKSNKPIMEKRRRARINQCLNELKSLILEALKKDPARHSKLEKADILEMTVKHLQTLQRQQLTTAALADPNVLTKFKTGFTECAAEVSRIMSRMEGFDNNLRQRLMSHLSGCMDGFEHVQPAPVLPFHSYPFSNLNDFNNNATRFLQSLNLIPGRLPTGETAFMIANIDNPSINNLATSSSTISTKVINEKNDLLSKNLSREYSYNITQKQSPSEFTIEIPESTFQQRISRSLKISMNQEMPYPYKRERDEQEIDRTAKQAKLSVKFSHYVDSNTLSSVENQNTSQESDNMWRPW